MERRKSLEMSELEKMVPILQPLGEGRKGKQYLAAIAATFGAFGIGTALSWTSPALPYLSSNSTCLDTPLTPEEGAWVGSLLAIGAIIGSIPTGWLADHFGRKWTIIGLSIPSLLSWVLIIFGRSAWIIYIARLLAGFSMGGFSVVTPMYVGEVAEVSVRGTLGSYFEVSLCFGILATYVVGAVVNYLWLAIIMAGIPTISITTFLFMPETPVYLLKKGKKSAAESILQYFRGVEYNIAPEIQIMQKEMEESAAISTSMKELLSSSVNIKALLIALGLMLVQQLSGVNIVIFYTFDIFSAAGSSLSPDMCAIIIGAVEAVFTYLSLLLVDRAGRRILLLCSVIPSFCCLTALGAFFYLKENDPETAMTLSWLPLVAVNIFIIAMSLGLGPIPWLMLGELFSSTFKGPATSASCLLNSFLVFFVTKTYVNFVSAVGIYGAFWFYAGTTGLGIIFIYFKVPETKGKTFLEIQHQMAL